METSHQTLYQWTFVEGNPINIIKCGNWKLSEKEKALFLIIPGNPGSMGFYETFAEALYSESGIPVWGISHTGHVTIPNDVQECDKKSMHHPAVQDCGLAPQIRHKILFLKNEVLPKVDKVYLIGHSIGCYIILHILDQMKEEKLQKGILLFPTIERMAISPKGRRMTPMLVKYRGFFSYLAWFIGFLPHFVKKALIDCLFIACNEPSKKTLLYDIIAPNVADCSSFMGMEEMLHVEKRDDDIIKEQAEKLHFYYGAIDHWCPVSYYEDMLRDYPNFNIQLCKKRFKHAFVLREAEPMASIVADMVKSF